MRGDDGGRGDCPARPDAGAHGIVRSNGAAAVTAGTAVAAPGVPSAEGSAAREGWIEALAGGTATSGACDVEAWLVLVRPAGSGQPADAVADGATPRIRPPTSSCADQSACVPPLHAPSPGPSVAARLCIPAAAASRAMGAAAVAGSDSLRATPWAWFRSTAIARGSPASEPPDAATPNALPAELSALAAPPARALEGSGRRSGVDRCP